MKHVNIFTENRYRYRVQHAVSKKFMSACAATLLAIGVTLSAGIVWAQHGAQAQAATGKYHDDEAKIQNASDKERYRTSELPQGEGVVKELGSGEFGTAVEGFEGNQVNPIPTSKGEKRKEFGIEIKVDKEKGQRTYTHIEITDTKNGAKPTVSTNKDAENPGSTVVSEDTTFKPEAKMELTNKGKNGSIILTEEDLKHINNKDTNKTVVGWKNKYRIENYKNNKGQIFNGDNAYFKFSVNPYPNENDALGIMKVDPVDPKKIPNDHYPVKGQLIRTGYKVSNVLANDQKRIVAEVYHPDGTYLEEAQAFIVTAENIKQYNTQEGFKDIKVGEILFKMPKGALQDENSVFNTEKYKGIHNLKVNVYARPRTKAEFIEALPNSDKIVPGTNPDDNNSYNISGEAHYTETGAGTKVIKHNGNDVTVDLQGIDRYDHYNLLGNLSINLDDTRYYDQVFDEKVQKPTDKMTTVKPGVSVIININDDFTPDTTKPRKTAAQMNEAKNDGRAKAELDPSFLKIAQDLGWTITFNTDGKDISQFTVTAPKTAKPGDFIAIPLTYTYTNGSIDNHWFHFVVQETNNNRPEYTAPVGMPGESLSTTPQLPTGDVANKKLQPKTYELAKNPDGTPITEYKDDKGNVWKNIKVDPKTGVVTADVPDNANIKGGERLFVPIKVNYVNEETGEKSEETVKAEFVAKVPSENKPEYHTQVGAPKAALTSTPETETSSSLVKPAGYALEENQTYKDDKDTTWTVSIDPTTGVVTANVPDKAQNGAKLTVPIKVKYVNPSTQKEYFKTIHAEFVAVKEAKASGAEVIHEYDKEIPFETKVEIDESLTSGQITEVTSGKAGKKHYTFKQTVQNGKKGKLVNGKLVENEFTLDEKVVEEKQDRVIKVGVKTNGEYTYTEHLPYNVTVEVDDTLDTDYKKVTDGQPGTKETKLTIVNSKVTKSKVLSETPSQDGLIKVKKDFTGDVMAAQYTESIPFETKYVDDPTWDEGETQVTQDGKPGSVEVTYTQTIKNGKADGAPVRSEGKRTEPTKRIIRRGTKNRTHTYEEQIPFDVEIVYDSKLEAGKTEIQQEGKPGKKTTTWQISNSQVLANLEVKEEKPQKKIIKVGTKALTGEISHTEHVDVPFETEIRFNPNLEAGKQNVLQEGEPGVQEITYNQKVKDSKADGALTKTTKKTKAPVKRIVEVGSRPSSAVCAALYPSESGFAGGLADSSIAPSPSSPATTPDSPISSDASVSMQHSRSAYRDDEARAPQTYDAGILPYVSLAALAGVLLAIVGIKRKRK